IRAIFELNTFCLMCVIIVLFFFFFFQAEDGIRDATVTGVQTCALPICLSLEGNDFRLEPTDAGRGLVRKGSALNRKYGYCAICRSEERRVGKEWRSRWWTNHNKTKKNNTDNSTVIINVEEMNGRGGKKI